MNKIIKITFLLSLILTNNVIAVKHPNELNLHQPNLHKTNSELEPILPPPKHTLIITFTVIFIAWAITSLITKITK